MKCRNDTTAGAASGRDTRETNSKFHQRYVGRSFTRRHCSLTSTHFVDGNHCHLDKNTNWPVVLSDDVQLSHPYSGLRRRQEVGAEQVIITTTKGLTSNKACTANTESSESDVAALYFKFPWFIKRKQLQDVITKRGYSDNIVNVDMHIHVPSRKPAGSAKVLITPASLQDKIIADLDGTPLQDGYTLYVQPFRQPKRKQRNAWIKSDHPHDRQQQLSCSDKSTVLEEPCTIFVGSSLPHRINESHIQNHFSELKEAIINVEFKSEKQGKGCFVLVTFESPQSARRAISQYHHTYLLDKHRLKVEMYKPQYPFSSHSSCPAMSIVKHACYNTTFKLVKPSECTTLSSEDESENGSTFFPSECSVDHKVSNVGQIQLKKLPEHIPDEPCTLCEDKGECGLGYNYLEENQLKNTATVITVENLDPSFSQSDIESLTGVKVTAYTPSHKTPSKIAAWIEVANCEYAHTVAKTLDGREIKGKVVHCSLSESDSFLWHAHSMPIQSTQNSPSTSEGQVVSFSESFDDHFQSHPGPKATGPDEYHPYFFVGGDSDTMSSHGSQLSLSQVYTPAAPLYLLGYPPMHVYPESVLPPVVDIPLRDEKTIALREEEWRHIITMQSNGSTLLDKIIAPFETNPNVKIQPQIGTYTIHISGTPEAVVSAYEHISDQLRIKDLRLQKKAEQVIKLRPEEWCHLTAQQISGTTLLQEIIAPLKTNPNVEIRPQEDIHTICVQGIPEAVNGAYNHIISHLNKDLHILNRSMMAALVHLNANLPHEICDKHAVSMTGFHKASSTIRFDGSFSAVFAARSEVDNLISRLSATKVSIAFPPSLISLAKRQLKISNCRTYIETDTILDTSVTVTVYSFEKKDHEQALTLLKSTPTEEQIVVSYSIFEKLSSAQQISKLEDEFCIIIKKQGVQKGEKDSELEITLIITGFNFESVKAAHTKLQGLIELCSEQRIKFDCSPEETIYLLRMCGKECRSLLSSSPAEVTITDNVIEFYGNHESIEKSRDKLHNGLLLGLQYRRFPYKCNIKFLSQIEGCVLRPLQNEKKLAFRYWVTKPETEKKIDNEVDSIKEQCIEFSITIYSKDESVFDKVCEAMKPLDPQTKEFQLTYRGAADCARKLKPILEARHYVRIIVRHDNYGMLVHGLIPSEIQQCWEMIDNEIKSTITTVKYVQVKVHECKYLERKCFDILRGKFSCDIAFPRERNPVCITGRVKDVEAVENEISKVIQAGVEVVQFGLSCSLRSFFMWKKWWWFIKTQEEEKHNNIIIEFDATVAKKIGLEGKLVDVSFELIGTDIEQLRHIQEKVSDKSTERKLLDDLEEGRSALEEAIKQQKMPFSDKLAIALDIDRVTKKFVLIAPKSLSDELDNAESEIRQFVQKHANVSKKIVSDDPVVGLVLTSSTKSAKYIKSAVAIAKPQKVTVVVSGYHLFGLKLTGSPSAVEKVEPQIRSTVFKQIEQTIDQTQIEIPSTHAVVFTASEFLNFETELQKNYCVALSYKIPGHSSKAACSVTIMPNASVHSLKLDICEGDIVNERVDAIVNAANEDLKHIGGVAKSILENGGITIKSESNEYVQSHGKVPTGSCVCLGSGKLPCKRVIHAVGPQWGGGARDELVEKTLHDTVYQCLLCADKEDLTSIALPAISTGAFGVPEEVCARASLNAVSDYCQSNPNSNISTIRFILTKSALRYFESSVKHMGTKHSCTATSRASNLEQLETEQTITWSWSNDVGSYSMYDSDISAKLTKEYKRNRSGSLACSINGQNYNIDFLAMTQTNCSTGYQRKVKCDIQPTHTSRDSTTQWEYMDDHQRWTPYSTQHSQAIEAMYQDKTPGELQIVGNTYTFDFTLNFMHQINVRTNFKRQIKRESVGSTLEISKTATDEEHLQIHDQQNDQAVADELGKINITLRGPRDMLPQAKHKLQERLKSLFVSQAIVYPPSLEKKLSHIAEQHEVHWSFQESISHCGVKRKGKQQKVSKIRVEGLSSTIAQVLRAIYDEIITHQVESQIDNGVEYPEEWEQLDSNATTNIFQVKRETDEWRHVAGRFQQTMYSARIIQITRIQNKWLWGKYVFQYKSLDIKNGGNVNEIELFHGSRNNDPKLIYENEDGFDMRYANSGMWGQANYFAEKASYSDNYAHTGVDGYKEIFFVKVLTGDSHECSPQSLRKPPLKPTGSAVGPMKFAQFHYDTVTGYTNGSQVYMTYDNEKAYPAYLIKYQ